MTDTTKGNLLVDVSNHHDVEQIARLMRYSRDGSLSEKSRTVIKGYILNQLGVENGVHPESGKQSVEGPSEASTMDVRNRATVRPAAVSQSAAAEASISQVMDADAEPMPAQNQVRSGSQRSDVLGQMELRIRHLVEADADWEKIEPLLTQLMKLDASGSAVPKCVELAFLRAKQTELENLFGQFRDAITRSWMDVHQAVRAHLVVRFWRCGASHILGPIVFRFREHHALLPVERLFVLQTLCKAQDPSLPWIYFKQYRAVIEDAVRELGSYISLDQNRFFLEMGRVALNLNFDKEARNLFERIEYHSLEHEEALQLILQSGDSQRRVKQTHYVELLLSQPDPIERLNIFSGFFDSTRGLGGFRDRNRPALNELLENPLDWLPADPQVLRKLSETLISNRDLEALLPNLFRLFNEQSLKFMNKDCDLALWASLAEMKPLNAKDQYWVAVGKLHVYANSGPANEILIWQAKELIGNAKETKSVELPYEWRVLHKNLFSWVAKSPYLVETERQKMLSQLRIAVAAEHLVIGDISDYLDGIESVSLDVARHLEALCREKRAFDVELKVTTKAAMASHLTNAQLNRIWQIAAMMNNHDLAWRTATLVNARGVLLPAVRHPWEISGEKRTTYPFNRLNKKVVGLCLRGLPLSAQKIIWALVNVGGSLPELLSYLDRGASAARQSSYPTDSLERKVDDALNKLGWLPALKKRYKFSFDATSGMSRVPAFAHVLPANHWSLLTAHISERLGLNAFQWKLSSLHDQIIDLIPRMAGRQDLKRYSSKVAKWLKDLSPEQRSAWYDLASLSRTMDDDTAKMAFATFVTRLSTLIYQNHLVAIQSLQAMRADVVIIWALESWMCGAEYQVVRKELGFESRVPVPNALLKAETIVSKTPSV